MSCARLVIFLFIFTLFSGALEGETYQLTVEASSGPAKGYIDNATCSMCHLQVHSQTLDTPHKNSFSFPERNSAIEIFDDEPFYHSSSRTYFRYFWQGDTLYFERYQKAADETPMAYYRRRVDVVFGSGRNLRLYGYQTLNKEMFLFPLAWYSQSRQWAMAPGYDKSEHVDVFKSVDKACLGCHTEFPQLASHDDSYWGGDQFTSVYNTSVGCQQCHGPGETHVSLLLSGERNLERIQDSIVRPGELSESDSMAICLRCHQTNSDSYHRMAKFGHGEYAIQPGRRLTDIQVLSAIDAPSIDGFKKEFHWDQGRQFLLSSCYQSEPEFGCTSCHSAHSNNSDVEKGGTPANGVTHSNRVCLDCHIPEQRGAHDKALGDWKAENAPFASVANSDCITCHMPKQKVGNSVYTHHQIGRTGAERISEGDRRGATTSVELVTDIESENLDRIYQAVVTLRRIDPSDKAAIETLSALLPKSEVNAIEPYLDLANGLMLAEQFNEAKLVLDFASHRFGEHELIKEWLVLIEQQAAPQAEHIAQFWADKVNENSTNIRPYMQLAVMLIKKGDLEVAEKLLHRAVVLKDNYDLGWLQLGLVREALGDVDGAIVAYRTVVIQKPGLFRGYEKLIPLLIEAGHVPQEVKRYIELAKTYPLLLEQREKLELFEEQLKAR
jgi:hypothetical protein